MNIILVIIDTLRYDHIGAHGNDWIKTPNLDALAARSRVFDRSFSASFPTIPHRTDVITGKYGSPLFPWRPLRWDHVTFPEIMAENGYCTQLIHDTPHLVNGGHNFDYPFHAWTQVRGAEVDRPWIDTGDIMLGNWDWDPLFDQFDKASVSTRLMKTYCFANRHRKKDADWNAARLFTAASRWLRDNAGRDSFFLWIDSFDPHEPWDVPPDFARLYDDTPGYDGRIDPRGFVSAGKPELTEAGRKRIKAWYAGKVSWVDRWFGELWNTLEETGLDERTALLLTSDHGTKVDDWGGRFHKGLPVREQEAHTPFMVYVPDKGSGRSDLFVQPQDVFATVLGIAGLSTPEELDCRDVLSQAERGEGKRGMALSGIAPGGFVAGHREKERSSFFTVFSDDYYLVFDADPQKCQLVRYGTQEDIAQANPSEVERLHRLGIEELARRGADPKLVDWLRSRGEKVFPEDCVFWDGYPGPPGYTQYFFRNYDGD